MFTGQREKWAFSFTWLLKSNWSTLTEWPAHVRLFPRAGPSLLSFCSFSAMSPTEGCPSILLSSCSFVGWIFGLKRHWTKLRGWVKAGCSHQWEGREGRERCLGGEEFGWEIWEQCLLLLLSLTSPNPAHSLPRPPMANSSCSGFPRSHMQAEPAAGQGSSFCCRQEPADLIICPNLLKQANFICQSYCESHPTTSLCLRVCREISFKCWCQTEF